MPKFTDKMLKGLKPPKSGQIDIWDELLPSFGVRIGKTGRKSFFVGTRIRGKYRRVTLKPPYDQLGLADARMRAREIIADAQTGIAPETRKKRASAGTFKAVADAFMADHAKNLRTRDEMARKVNVELRAWHDLQIGDITRANIKELLREKARGLERGVSANRLLALISKIFSWALDEEIIDASPALRLKRPAEEIERERFLSADEIRRLWPAFGALGYPFGLALKFLLVTGQRRGEVSGMRWTEIDGDAWLLPGARSKSKQGHRVPLSSLAQEILNDVPRIGEFVFMSGRGLKPIAGWEAAKRRGDSFLKEPIEHWIIHDLRRTMATHIRTIGVDKLVVSKILNHAEGGVTRIYDRYAADPEKTAAMERWANRLREIISGAPADNVVQMKIA